MKMRPCLTWMLACALAVGAPAAALAQESAGAEEARGYFTRGVELHRDGAYEAALIQFQRAYATLPNFRVLYNIGQTALRLQRYAESLDAYERYLAGGGAEVPADRRAQVEQEIARLKTRVSSVTIQTRATEGEVLVDDARVATLPLADPIRMSAGRRKITVAAKGTAPITRIVEVPGRDPVTVDMAALEAPPPVPPPKPAPAAALAPTPPAPRSYVAPIITGSITGALGVGAAIGGVFALDAKRDVDRELARYPGQRDALDDAQSRRSTTALVTDILIGAAVLGAGITVYLLAAPPSETR